MMQRGIQHSHYSKNWEQHSRLWRSVKALRRGGTFYGHSKLWSCKPTMKHDTIEWKKKKKNEDMVMDDQNGQEDSKTSDKDITIKEEYFEYNMEWAGSPRERNIKISGNEERSKVKKSWK